MDTPTFRNRPAQTKSRSPGVAIHGHFSSPAGGGEAARGAARALQLVGYPVSCHDIHNRNFAFAADAHVLAGDTQYDTALLWLIPDAILRLHEIVNPSDTAGRHCIAQWAWELPVFPADWNAAFHQLDEVWTPSQYCAASVAMATEKPVRVVPHAVETAPVDTVQARAEFGLTPDEIVFACIFDPLSYVARKNPFAAVRAFRDAFPMRSVSSVRLLIKCSGWRNEAEWARQLKAAIADDARILLHEQIFPREKLRMLQAACDVYVSLHRAEGFGLNIAECMALGKLAIVTNFSGNTDFTTSENALLVDYRMTRVLPGEYLCGDGQWWAEPDHDAAVAALRTAYEDAALRARLGERARMDIVTNYSYPVAGRKIVAALECKTELTGPQR